MIAVSKDPPRFRKYRNGHSYSKRTAIYTVSCRVCGNQFLGSYDKWYCSNTCRDKSRCCGKSGESEKMTDLTEESLLKAIEVSDSAKVKFRAAHVLWPVYAIGSMAIDDGKKVVAEISDAVVMERADWERWQAELIELRRAATKK